MTTELLIKGFIALIFSGIFVWMTLDRMPDDSEDSRRQRYLPYISGFLLPACILTLMICAFLFYDTNTAVQVTLSFCFGVFLQICLYYILLIFALPFLRRHINARACAVLWMLPNYLYVTQMSYMRLPEPSWVVEVPFVLVRVLLIVWVAGFLTVMGLGIVSHLLFRFRILRKASPVTDEEVLELWRQEVEFARFRKPKFKLVVSPEVRTPLSVGLFQRTVRIVLPKREYTSAELALIFRHELIHIGREDARNKFFLLFCTAMCWFNPLMWVAVKRSSEDLELSCDETVLQDSDGDVRRRYAELLLNTAGDERGFTTCLSASAKALRYRLKNVVTPKKKHSGALTVGLTFFLLCMSSGHVALAYGEDTGAEVIYQSQSMEQYTLYSARWNHEIYNDKYNVNAICTDENALHRYLSALRMEHIAGNYSFDQEGKSLFLIFDTLKGTLTVTLFDKYIKLVPIYGKVSAEYYYLPDGADWDLLSQCVLECPTMNVHVTGSEGGFGRDFDASLWRLSLGEGSGEILYEMDDRETPSGLYGYGYNEGCEAVLSFSLPLKGDCVVEIVPLGGGNSRIITLNEQSMALPLPEESCCYIVHGEFLGKDGKCYRAEFRFEIGGLR